MTPTPTDAEIQAVNVAVLDWINQKLADAEKALKAREQMESSWREGSSKDWKAVGCKMSKSERLKESATQGIIAAKCRRDVAMFKAVIAKLSSPHSAEHF